MVPADKDSLLGSISTGNYMQAKTYHKIDVRNCKIGVVMCEVTQALEGLL